MNSYLVFVDRIHRESIVVTATSEEEARQKVLDHDYDDVIDSEPMDEFVESSMTVELSEEDVDEED